MGYRDGQDILTLSLGGPNGWTESSSSVVASRIASSGKIVTIAAGNDVRRLYLPEMSTWLKHGTGRLWVLVYVESRERCQRHFRGERGQASSFVLQVFSTC